MTKRVQLHNHNNNKQLHNIHLEASKLLQDPIDIDYARLNALREHALSLESSRVPLSPHEGYVPYPDIMEPNFISNLLRKKEFHEHYASASDDISWTGRCQNINAYFEHTLTQLIVRNFMSPLTPYNSLLIAHGTGLGKTCAAVTIAEQFSDTFRNGVMIITRPSLVDTFRRTIFDLKSIPIRDGELDFEHSLQCTGTKYTDAIVDKHILSRSQLDHRISRMVSDRYTFMGPLKFANSIQDLVTDAQGGMLPVGMANKRIRDRFSESMLIIDEAHLLRGGDGKKLTPLLKRVLSVCPNIKLILMTATPMFNEAVDILDIVNILLINDKRPPLKNIFNSEGKLVDATSLTKALQGYVSFARINDPISFPICLDVRSAGDSAALKERQVPFKSLFDDKEISKSMRLRHVSRFIIGSRMGVKQRGPMDAIVEQLKKTRLPMNFTDEDDIDENESDTLSNISKLSQMSNIVFPNGRSFHETFVKMSKGNGQLRVSYREHTPHILSPNLIHDWAPKIARIVERVSTSSGIAMVYSRFVWSGIVPVALALEHVGFRPFRGQPLLEGIRVRPTGQLYAIISGQNIMDVSIDAILSEATSEENIDGSRLKVILISDRGSEGITLKCVREVHVLEPWFHLNKIDQVMGRGSRLCSHSLLPMECRNLTLYLHALLNEDNNHQETIDLFTYRHAEMKQYEIAKVELILRQHAFDCNLVNPYQIRIKEAVAKMSLNIQTSQNKVIRNQPIQSADITNVISESTHFSCIPDMDLSTLKVNTSTYDARVHAYNQVKYHTIIKQVFNKTEVQSMKVLDLWLYVQKHLESADYQDFLRELSHLIQVKSIIISSTGRKGYLLRRGALVLFQPIDETSTILTDAERAHPIVRKSISVQDIGVRKMHISSNYQQHDSYIQYVLNVMNAFIKKVDQKLQDLLGGDKAYMNVVIDSVIDSLDHDSLVELIKASLPPKDVKKLIPKRIRLVQFSVQKSLWNAWVLSSPTSSMRVRFMSPFFPNDVFEIGEDGVIQQNEASKEDVDARPHAAILYDKAMGVMAISGSGKQQVVQFKVLDPVQTTQKSVRGAKRSGCVCKQSSQLTMTNMVKRIRDVAPGGQIENHRMTKIQLCELYELVLRRHRPDAILRPIQTRIVQAQ